MIHGDMKASATSWRRRAERRRLRRRSAARACSRAAAGRSAMVAMSWASAQLELVGEDVEEGLEVRVGLELLVLQRLEGARHVLEAVGDGRQVVVVGRHELQQQ